MTSTSSNTDTLSEDEALKFLVPLGDFMVAHKQGLKMGQRALELTTDTLRCLSHRLHDKKLGKGKGVLGFFKINTTGQTMEDVRDGVFQTSYVVVTSPPSGGDPNEAETTMKPSEIDVSEFPSLAKLDIRRVAITGLRGAKDVSEFLCNQCSLNENSMVFENLKSVRAVRLYHCNMYWNSIQHVSTSVCALCAQNCLNGGVLSFPVSRDKPLSWICLTDLDMSNNGFKSLDASCTALVSLTRIDLSFNELRDIGPLVACKNIRSANLSNNRFRSLDAVCQCLPEVSSLNLSHNEIQSLVGLDKSPNIEMFRIEANRLRNFDGAEEAQAKCTQLQSIFFLENPVFESVKPKDITLVQRAVFSSRRKMTIEGVQYMPLDQTTLGDIKKLYSALWPSNKGAMEEPPLSPRRRASGGPSSAGTTVKHTTVVVREMQEDSGSAQPTVLAETLQEIEKRKKLYGEDWSAFGGLEPTSQGETKTQQVTANETTVGKKKIVRVVKKVVRKKVVGEPTSQHEDPMMEPAVLNESFVASDAIGGSEPLVSPRARDTMVSLKLENNTPLPLDLPPSPPKAPSMPNALPDQSEVLREKSPPRSPPRSPKEPPRPITLDEQPVRSTDYSLTPAPSLEQKNISAIVAAHQRTQWKELSPTELNAVAWVGVRNALEMIPRYSFPRSSSMKCRVFPLISGPLWEEEDTKDAAEIWIADPKVEPSDPRADLLRYQDRVLLKVIEHKNIISGVRYLQVRQRRLTRWELDPSWKGDGEGMVSSFDRTPVVIVCKDNAESVYPADFDPTSEPRVSIRNTAAATSEPEKRESLFNLQIGIPAAPFTPRTRTSSLESKKVAEESGESMSGVVRLKPTDAVQVQTSIGLMSRQKVLCGFVCAGVGSNGLSTSGINAALAKLIQTRISQLLDETSGSSLNGTLSSVVPLSSDPATQASTANLEKTLSTVQGLPLSQQRCGSFPPVTPDEVEMHLKLSVFGKDVDPKILEAYGVNVPLARSVMAKEPRSPRNSKENLIFSSYVNFVLSSDKESDERSGFFCISDETVYFTLDYNTSSPALQGLSHYFIPFTSHPRNTLKSIHVGYNYQYIRVTFSVFSSLLNQAYLLLTRDVSLSVGLLKNLEALASAEGLSCPLVTVDSPFVARPLPDAQPVLGYFLMFMATVPRRATSPRSVLNKTSIAVKSLLKKGAAATTDFPQTVYPLRHTAKEMVPVSIVVTSAHIYALTESYHHAWPDDPPQYQVLRCSDVQDLQHIEVVNEKGTLASLAFALSFVGDDEVYDRWVLMSQHGAIAPLMQVLSKASFDKLKIQLPRVDMSADHRKQLFEIDNDRRELLVSGLMGPYRKAYAVRPK